MIILGQGVGKSQFLKSEPESESEFRILQSESESESDEMAGSEKLCLMAFQLLYNMLHQRKRMMLSSSVFLTGPHAPWEPGSQLCLLI
jgi:hypothetical protein